MSDWLSILAFTAFCFLMSAIVAYSIIRGDGPAFLGVLGL